MTQPTDKPLSQLFRETVNFDERIEELCADLRDEPDHNSNHTASMISGELSGLMSCKEALDPIFDAVAKVLENLNSKTACFNTGYYSHLKLTPGMCDCKACETNKAIEELRKALEAE